MNPFFSAVSAKREPQIAPSAAFSHPTWASARKDMVGASLGSSRLWFTIAEGIVTEVYYPRIDIPQIKDLGFIIADDKGFWVELRRLDSYSVSLASPGVPAVEIIHRHPRFVFTLQVCPSQRRDVLLLRCSAGGRRVAATLCAVVGAPGRRRGEQCRVGRAPQRQDRAVGGPRLVSSSTSFTRGSRAVICRRY